MHGYAGFRELDRQECLRLPALVPIGRLVYTDRALPAVLPVIHPGPRLRRTRADVRHLPHRRDRGG
ncbi:hypothetical protein [Actinopolymorpha alba]|uniref:hypothetical protein n=1 Tax=Actinopolymorpha alba TaxID=533267 RepID=UPI000399D6F9|nr:hypothetical protein [Actinopolymorpha alba]